MSRLMSVCCALVLCVPLGCAGLYEEAGDSHNAPPGDEEAESPFQDLLVRVMWMVPRNWYFDPIHNGPFLDVWSDGEYAIRRGTRILDSEGNTRFILDEGESRYARGCIPPDQMWLVHAHIHRGMALVDGVDGVPGSSILYGLAVRMRSGEYAYPGHYLPYPLWHTSNVARLDSSASDRCVRGRSVEYCKWISQEVVPGLLAWWDELAAMLDESWDYERYDESVGWRDYRPDNRCSVDGARTE